MSGELILTSNLRSNYLKISKSVILMPIRVVLVYLCTTVILYAFGPIKYKTRNPLLLYSYLSIAYYLLYWGFVRGVKINPSRLQPICKLLVNNPQSLSGVSKRIFRVMLILSLLILHITLFERTGSLIFDFSVFKNFNVVYGSPSLYALSGGESYIEWMRILMAPITLMYFPIGVVNWKKIGFWERLIVIYLVTGNILLLLVKGINKGFADAIIYLFVYLILYIYQSNFKFKTGKVKYQIKKKLNKVFRFIIVIGAIFVFVFTLNIASRLNETDSNIIDSIDYLTMYVTHGYSGLDYAFDQPFESTYGFGSSMYLIQASRNWFGSDFLYNRTYLSKNEREFGWDQKKAWSTIFVWIGNDISLFGAMLIMYFVGRLYGKVWIESIQCNNIHAIVLSALLTQLCFYIPANHQIVQTTEALLGTIVIFLFWMIKKIRLKQQFHNYHMSNNLMSPKEKQNTT